MARPAWPWLESRPPGSGWDAAVAFFRRPAAKVGVWATGVVPVHDRVALCAHLPQIQRSENVSEALSVPKMTSGSASDEFLGLPVQ